MSCEFVGHVTFVSSFLHICWILSNVYCGRSVNNHISHDLKIHTIKSVQISFNFTYKLWFMHLWIHFYTQNCFYTFADYFLWICGSRYICKFLFMYFCNFVTRLTRGAGRISISGGLVGIPIRQFSSNVTLNVTDWKGTSWLCI